MLVEINNECVVNLLNVMGIRIFKYINILMFWCFVIFKVDVVMEIYIVISKVICLISKFD